MGLHRCWHRIHYRSCSKLRNILIVNNLIAKSWVILLIGLYQEKVVVIFQTSKLEHLRMSFCRKLLIKLLTKLIKSSLHRVIKLIKNLLLRMSLQSWNQIIEKGYICRLWNSKLTNKRNQHLLMIIVV